MNAPDSNGAAAAFSECRELALTGHADAQFRLGKMHEQGVGVPRNSNEALLWYRKAAEQGFAAAQNQLGVTYIEGSHATGPDIEQDYAQACDWFHKAADQGHAPAQLNLGIAHAHGYGVPRDAALALTWFAKAAEQGVFRSGPVDIAGDCVLAYAIARLSAAPDTPAESISAQVRPQYSKHREYPSHAEVYAGEELARLMAPPWDPLAALRRYIEQPVLPLPELPVLRTSHCSQEMTDSLIRFVEENNPELLRKVRSEESWYGEYKYPGEDMWYRYDILEYVDRHAGHIGVPRTRMGRYDLVSELVRRMRRAHGLPDRKPRGKPLADSMDGPFPPLLELAVPQSAVTSGITQSFADEALQMAYRKRPDLWWALAEARNTDIDVGQHRDFEAFLTQIVETEFADRLPAVHAAGVISKNPQLFWATWILEGEARRRLDEMCQIK
jgi:Sel1 repeat-containing protein